MYRTPEIHVESGFTVGNEREVVDGFSNLSQFLQMCLDFPQDLFRLKEFLAFNPPANGTSDLAVRAGIRAALGSDVVNSEAPSQSPRRYWTKRDQRQMTFRCIG